MKKRELVPRRRKVWSVCESKPRALKVPAHMRRRTDAAHGEETSTQGGLQILRLNRPTCRCSLNARVRTSTIKHSACNMADSISTGVIVQTDQFPITLEMAWFEKAIVKGVREAVRPQGPEQDAWGRRTARQQQIAGTPNQNFCKHRVSKERHSQQGGQRGRNPATTWDNSLRPETRTGSSGDVESRAKGTWLASTYGHRVNHR